MVLSIVSSIYIAILILFAYTSKERIFMPYNMFILCYILWYGFRSFILSFAPQSFVFCAFDIKNDIVYIYMSLIYTMLFLSIMTLLYRSDLYTKSAKFIVFKLIMSNRYPRTNFPKILLFMYFFGAISYVYNIYTMNYIGIFNARANDLSELVMHSYSFNNIIISSILPIIADFAFIYLTVLFFNKTIYKRFDLLLYACVVTIELIYSYLTGTKGAIISFLLIFLLSSSIYNKKVFGLLVALSPIMLILIFFITSYYREQAIILLNNKDSFDLYYIVKQLISTYNSTLSGISGLFNNLKDTFIYDISTRFGGLDAFSTTLKSLDNGTHYMYGKTLLYAIKSSMPRIIFPDRITFIVGYWFPVNYLGRSAENLTVIPLPRLLEFYINFSLLGIVIWALFMPFLLKIGKLLYNCKTNLSVTLYIYFVLNIVVAIEKPILNLISLWKPVLLILAIYFFITKKTDNANNSGVQPVGYT